MYVYLCVFERWKWRMGWGVNQCHKVGFLVQVIFSGQICQGGEGGGAEGRVSTCEPSLTLKMTGRSIKCNKKSLIE